MAEYHITTLEGPLNTARKFNIRKRSDAAYLAFNRHVDAMVRSQARLDTAAGVKAQIEARNAWTAIALGGSVKVELCGDTVLVERVV